MADRIEIEISAINNASRVFDTVINSVAKISPSFATAAQGVATFAAENAAMIGVVAGAGIALFDFEKKAVKVALEYNQAVH